LAIPSGNGTIVTQQIKSDINQSKILLCDDSVANLMLVKKLLESDQFTNIKAVADPLSVLEEMKVGDYDLLMLDIEMPVMDGLEVMHQLHRRKLIDEYFPIIILTGRKDEETRNKALTQGAVDFINKPFSQTEVLLRVRNTLKLRAAYQFKDNLAEELEKQVALRTEALEAAQTLLVKRLAMAGEFKDKDTGNHVTRVGLMAELMAELADLPEEVALMIGKAAPLHDVGKIAIPDNILLKNGQLDEPQWLVMKTHTDIGAQLLFDSQSHLAQMAASIALTHHEKWDGSGYPNGLSGEAIPMEGRITAICDVFDALMSKRPYKEAWSLDASMAEIQKLSGTQFDPTLIKLFFNNLDKFMQIQHDLKG
jgi:putative two-component system response regulator